MPARLILFTEPIILTVENIPSLLGPLKEQIIPENLLYTEQTFGPGTYELPIPSSARYTLTIEADGRGMLQRTMAAPGNSYATFPGGREKESIFLATEKEQKTEIDEFGPETRVTLPIIIGSGEGFILNSVFFNTPEIYS